MAGQITGGVIDRTREVIRQSLVGVSAAAQQVENNNVNNALDYAERKDDHDHVRTKLKERGAIGLRKKEDGSGFETYTKQRTAQMIDSGEYEVVTSGVMT
jgi:hypothetical protein